MLGKATLLNRRFFLLLTIYHRAGGLSRLFLKINFFTKGGEECADSAEKAKKKINPMYTVITADFGFKETGRLERRPPACEAGTLTNRLKPRHITIVSYFKKKFQSLILFFFKKL